MAVAKNQISEIKNIIEKYLNKEQSINLFNELKKTVAYTKNKSYQQTIDRILEELK